MALHYAAVARGTVVLVECNLAAAGNVSLVALSLLAKLPPSAAAESRASYTAEQHVFHVQAAGGLTFLCVADEAAGKRVPFAFLEEVQRDFAARFGARAAEAAAYELSAEYSPVLKQKLEYFSDPRNDRLTRVRGEVGELKNVLVDNIDKVLDRGERLELLVSKTESLSHSSFAFKRQARGLRNQMWWKNVKLSVSIGLLVLLAAYILVAVICSPTFHCSS